MTNSPKQVDARRKDDPDNWIFTEQMRRNVRFDRHVGFAESCSRELLITLIENQRAILIKLGRQDIIDQNTRPEDFDKLKELDKRALDMIYTRLSIHVL